MSQIRKAHSVEIIEKRLRQYESADLIDAMELIELHDELSRVERKWLEKLAQQQSGHPGTRPLSNAEEMDSRFDRLSRLIDASLRKLVADAPERALLSKISQELKTRSPLKTA